MDQIRISVRSHRQNALTQYVRSEKSNFPTQFTSIKFKNLKNFNL